MTKPSLASTASTISYLTNDTIQEINRKDQKYSVKELLETRRDEGLNASVALKQLRVSTSIGTYIHTDPKITDWIRGNFEDMEGTLQEAVYDLALSSLIGFSDCEINWKSSAPGFRSQWRLRSLQAITPDKVGYAGTRRGVTHVIDKSHPSAGDARNWIPMGKVIHVDFGAYDGSPWGQSLAEIAKPLIKAKKTLLTEWIVAGRNQAAGLFVCSADSTQSVTLLDHNGNAYKNPDGSPRVVSAIQQLATQMGKLDETGILIIDKQNEVRWQPMSADSSFFMQALQYLDTKILLSQLIPKLTFDEGSSQFGNTSIAMMQKTLLDSQLIQITKKIQDQIIEKIVRPLLVFNFGMTAKSGWGGFTVDVSADQSQAQARLGMLTQVVASQIIPATDPGVVDSVRKLLDLPNQSNEESLQILQQAAEVQGMQQKIVLQAQMEAQMEAQQAQEAQAAEAAQQAQQAQPDPSQQQQQYSQPYP